VPLHYGDLAKQGLAGWYPDGIFQWLLESVQVATGMPWTYTIITGIIVWRILTMPLAVAILRKTGRVAGRPAPDFRSEPQDQKRYDSYCLEMDRAVKVKDVAKEQLIRSKIYSLFPADYDLATWRLFVHSLSLSSLFGISGLLALPLEQLRHGGGFIPDLTIATSIADPYFILPSTFVILGLSWIQVSATSLKNAIYLIDCVLDPSTRSPSAIRLPRILQSLEDTFYRLCSRGQFLTGSECL
jgi:YidC/Oxa1 family membrane protein insertase